MLVSSGQYFRRRSAFKYNRSTVDDRSQSHVGLDCVEVGVFSGDREFCDRYQSFVFFVHPWHRAINFCNTYNVYLNPLCQLSGGFLSIQFYRQPCRPTSMCDFVETGRPTCTLGQNLVLLIILTGAGRRQKNNFVIWGTQWRTSNFTYLLYRYFSGELC